MRKINKIAVLALTASALFSSTAFAGTWKQDAKGWWYQNDDGSYPISSWKWIDGNNDGVAECYYFGADGYMLANTITPDNYIVNTDGAWVVNGIIQTNNVPQTTQPAPAETKPAETQAPTQVSQSEDKGYLTEEEVKQREQEDNGFVDYTEGFTPGNGNPVGEQINMDQLEKYKLN